MLILPTFPGHGPPLRLKRRDISGTQSSLDAGADARQQRACLLPLSDDSMLSSMVEAQGM